MLAKKLYLSIAILLLGFSAMVYAETWVIGEEAELLPITIDRQGQYVLAVSHIKQLVETGQSAEAAKAFEKLKQDYPEIDGKDFDRFMTGEMLFAQGKFEKASWAYDKFIAEHPTSELYEAALERQYQIGTALLAGQKVTRLKVFRLKGYDQGEKVMQKISDRMGDAPLAQRAMVTTAQSYENRKKYVDAYDNWSMVNSIWSTGQTGKNSHLAMARCMYLDYRGPKYDDSSLISAKSYYESFKLRYPQDAQRQGIGKKLIDVQEQLAQKQLDIGKYYDRTKSFTPAEIYYQMVIEKFPGTSADKEVQKLLPLLREKIANQKIKDEKDKNEDKKKKSFLGKLRPF